MTPRLSILAVLVITTSVASAQERAMEFGDATGEPGEVVEVAVFGTFEEPLRALLGAFHYDFSRLEFIAFRVDGTEAAGTDPASILFHKFDPGEANFGFSNERQLSSDFRIPAGERFH